MTILTLLVGCGLPKDDISWEGGTDCIDLEVASAYPVPKDSEWDPDWYYDDRCALETNDPLTVGDGEVTSITVKGLTDETVDPAVLSRYPDTRNMLIGWRASSLAGDYVGHSESALADGVDGEWTTTYDGELLRADHTDGIDCSYDFHTNCAGYYDVHIEEADDLGTCEYQPAEICFRYREVGGGDIDEDSVDCTPGSGSFTLAGYRWYDDDQDGEGALVLGGVQTTGTGVMANHGTVTQIRVVDDGGYDLRLIDNDTFFAIDENDQLVDSASVSQRLTRTHNFPAGKVRGNPIFVMTGVDADDTSHLRVDMTWQCRTSGWTPVSLTQGYQKRLADLGCGTIKQKITLRPDGDRISLELYGQPLARKWSALGPSVAGKRSFSFATTGGLSIQGRLGEHNSTSATIYLDTLKWKGTNMCTTGQYTFPAE